MAQRLLSPSPQPRPASSAGAGTGALRKATQGKEAQPCGIAAVLCRTEARLRHQTQQSPRGATCSGRTPLPTRRLAGLSATPWRPMTATTVSRAGHTSLPHATLTSRRRRPSLRSREPMLRAARADCAVAPLGRPAIRRRSALPQLPSRRRGTDLTNHDHDEEPRRARLMREARDALCLVMLAACTVALIRSQILTAEPPMVPACELFALAAVLRALLGPKQPPPRGLMRA
jgi:hypothetical protein